MKPLTRQELQREVGGLLELVKGYLHVYVERAEKPELEPDVRNLSDAYLASQIASALLKEAAERELRGGQTLN